MFQVLEKDGRLQPVHSKGDLEYMQRRGWRAVETAPPVAQAAFDVGQRVEVIAPAPKRKYTRRAR